jgi:hypothetical protein
MAIITACNHSSLPVHKSKPRPVDFFLLMFSPAAATERTAIKCCLCTRIGRIGSAQHCASISAGDGAADDADNDNDDNEDANVDDDDDAAASAMADASSFVVAFAFAAALVSFARNAAFSRTNCDRANELERGSQTMVHMQRVLRNTVFTLCLKNNKNIAEYSRPKTRFCLDFRQGK